MKKILFAIASVAALSAVSMPAAAQTYRGHGGYGGYEARNDIDARQAQIRNRIVRAEQNGRLSPREARALRLRLSETQRLEYRFRVNDGRISPREYAVLDQRLDALQMQLRAEIRDGNRRYGAGYGRW